MKRMFCVALFGSMALPCAASVQVIQVKSALGGTEFIAGGNSVSRHHGGSPVLVTTREAGRSGVRDHERGSASRGLVTTRLPKRYRLGHL